MAGRKGRSGGPRPGAGAKRRRAVPVPWRRVEAAARVGATEEEIVRGLPLPPGALEDPANLTRFRDALAVGHALYRLDLRTLIKRRGRRTVEQAGSVNALALQARNVLDWDTQVPEKEPDQDLGTARSRLLALVGRLAAARSEIEGRPVTPLEVLFRESHLEDGPVLASDDDGP